MHGARNSREGQSSGTATHRAGLTPLAAEKPLGETVCESARAETLGHLLGGESSEGELPKSAAGAKKSRQGTKGLSRREGNQTLRAERSG